jgi:hypothetical protein
VAEGSGKEAAFLGVADFEDELYELRIAEVWRR